jgi:hypothetical protein
VKSDVVGRRVLKRACTRKTARKLGIEKLLESCEVKTKKLPSATDDGLKDHDTTRPKQ